MSICQSFVPRRGFDLSLNVVREADPPFRSSSRPDLGVVTGVSLAINKTHMNDISRTSKIEKDEIQLKENNCWKFSMDSLWGLRFS